MLIIIFKGKYELSYCFMYCVCQITHLFNCVGFTKSKKSGMHKIQSWNIKIQLLKSVKSIFTVRSICQSFTITHNQSFHIFTHVMHHIFTVFNLNGLSLHNFTCLFLMDILPLLCFFSVSSYLPLLDVVYDMWLNSTVFIWFLAFCLKKPCFWDTLAFSFLFLFGLCAVCQASNGCGWIKQESIHQNVFVNYLFGCVHDDGLTLCTKMCYLKNPFSHM